MLAQFPLGLAGEPVLSPHQPWQEGDRIVVQRADDPGRALWLSGQRRTRRPARFGAGRPTGVRPTKNGALYISEYSNHFFIALCKLSPGRNWPAISAVSRCADAELAAELLPEWQMALTAPGTREWEEAFGERVPRARDAVDQGHVRPPIGAGRGTDRHPRSPHRLPISHDDKADRIGRHSGPAPSAAPTVGQRSGEILAAFWSLRGRDRGIARKWHHALSGTDRWSEARRQRRP